MERAAWLKRAIAAGAEFHVRHEPRWRHNLVNLAALAGCLAIVAVIARSSTLLPWWGHLPLGGFLMACVDLGLFVLVIHEASHDMFVVARDADRTLRWNRLFGRLFSAPFFTDYIRHWEEGHRAHHLQPCVPGKDPQRFPVNGRPLLKTIAKVLLVPGYVLKLNPSAAYPGRLRRTLVGLAVWVALGATALLEGVSWTFPAACVLGLEGLMVLNLLKIAQEHGSGLLDLPDVMLRSRTYFYPLRWLCSPFNINYHFEHHLHFKVPWYRLPAYHRRVREIMPEPLRPYFFHRDYWAQLMNRKPVPPPELQPLMVGGG